MKLVDGALARALAAPRACACSAPTRPLADADGFVDTGDMIESRGDRCLFIGRRGGIINVGGAKAHPEEVEAVLNGLAARARLPRVRQGRARSPARWSPPRSC